MAQEINQPHDRIFKASMSQINVARSMVQQYLPQGILKHLNLDTLCLCSGSFIDPDMSQTHSDMLYSVEIQGEKAYVYLLWEHQSSYDMHMPLRMLSYCCSIIRQHIKQGFKKLPLVIPTLVYNGTDSPYPGSTDILDSFENSGLARQFFLKPFNLLDLTVTQDEALLNNIWTACPNMLLKHMRAPDFLPILSKLLKPMQALCDANGAMLVEVVIKSIIKYTNIPDEDKWFRVCLQLLFRAKNEKI